MRVPVGIICSILGAAVLSYLAIVTLIALPSEGSPRWFAVGGIVGLSLIVGFLVNGISIQDFRRVSRGQQVASNLYNGLTSRLSPLLYGGIEDLLHRRVKDLNRLEGLKFTVAAPIDGFYRVVAASFPPAHPLRLMELEPNEGVIGFTASRKVPAFTQTVHAKGPDADVVFDCITGEGIGHRGPIRDVNRGKMGQAGKWLYTQPIFERSVDTPWSNRVVGVLTAHSDADDGDRLFKNADFQLQLDSLASDVAPYLDAVHTLMAKENS